MSPEDETGKALRLLLEPFVSKVIPPQRSRKPTIMAMVLRYDPEWKPTATTVRGRDRQAGKRLIEIYAARDAAMTSEESTGQIDHLIDDLSPKR